MFGGEILPELLGFIKGAIGADPKYQDEYQEKMETDPPVINHAFLEELGQNNFSRRSFGEWERIMHSHGATFQEMNELKSERFERFADCVLYPDSHENCETIV